MSDSWLKQRDDLCLKIQNKFNIQPFQRRNLLITALTSNDKIVTDHDFKNNMKIDGKKDLATIGDTVIDYLIFEKFKGDRSRSAEDLNYIRETHGNNRILHQLSKNPDIKIDEDILWTKNDNCAKNGKICLAVYFEALVAVIFIDHGIDEVRKFFDTIKFFENVKKVNENNFST
jgi:dsRNA-specific ribonuclease